RDEVAGAGPEHREVALRTEIDGTATTRCRGHGRAAVGTRQRQLTGHGALLDGHGVPSWVSVRGHSCSSATHTDSRTWAGTSSRMISTIAAGSIGPVSASLTSTHAGSAGLSPS